MGCQEQQAGRQALGWHTDEGPEPLPGGAIADLVVVLDTDDKAVTGQVSARGAMATVTVATVAAIEDEGLLEQSGDILAAPVIDIVALAFAAQVGVQGMVKVVAPLRLQPVATTLRGPQQTYVIEIAFSDHVHLTATPAGYGRGGVLDVAENMARAEVID